YRLFEMKRILKPTGSIFLHCDPTASHYIKVIMDGIFGHRSFQNEIIWKRTSAHSDTKQGNVVHMGRVHDVILFYTKSDQSRRNEVYQAYNEEYVDKFYRHVDADGRRFQLGDLTGPGGASKGNPQYEFLGVTRFWRYSREKMQELYDQGRIVQSQPGAVPRYKRYLDEMQGTPLQDLWDDINSIGAQAVERLGYPTQKPLALLERIVQTGSDPDDVVFDPFCGCGTAIYAAHLQGRKWIGCDIAILSVQLVRDVLLKRYGLKEKEHYKISGVPLSVEGAEDLFNRDPRQFQHWAVELAGGFSSTKHSGDLGIDGRIHYQTQGGLKNMVLSVKGGKLTPAFMRELHGVMEREQHTEMGGLICLQPPTKGMVAEAASAGIYSYLGTDYHRLQIRTIEDLLNGQGFDTPSKVQTLNWVNQLPLPL
ncbi:MAG TPA: DNA methyltransferase, partial [Anaerolineales bacterium]|nr:DNA methyltransferase [Anaerolineales bacterium]